MCESYARSLLRVSVAQICQALGWDAVQLTACDLLSDVLHRYIQQLARVCHRYSELYGRTDPVLDDVSQAFRLMGVSLGELEDYVNNLESVPFPQQTPLFPVSKNNVLQFPQPGARDVEERKDYIPDHMPPLVSLQEEEEEEEVPPDMGTSAEAMQVALEEDEEEMDEDETVNDENHPLKRHLDSPDAALGMMPNSKRPRLYSGLSPEWGVEPREPLISLNPQRILPGILPSHDSFDQLSPETPPGVPPSFRPQPIMPKHFDQKGLTTPGKKTKISSPGRQRTKSPKGVVPVPVAGSPIHSPKPSKERKKSPGRTKSPKSPKSPKMSSAKAPQPPSKTEGLHKLQLSALNERMGKENIRNIEERELAEGAFKKLEPDNTAIDDSIDAVVARAGAEAEPDPFAFSSGSDSDSNGFSSPKRLTIMEPFTPKLPIGEGNLKLKETSTPLHLPLHAGMGGNWTLEDSINEVVRKANQGGPSAPPQSQAEYVSSGSASPPTPQPLLKVFEEKNNIVASVDVKKKTKKELKFKMKKKEKDKPKDKDREKDRSKLKEKNKDKNKDKSKEFPKDVKMPWKEFGMKIEDHFLQQDLTLPEGSIKAKSKDGDGSKKEKEKHKDKKKDKEKSKKDKDKKEKGKDKNKEDKQKQPGLSAFALGEVSALFSPATCHRITTMLPPLAPILQEKETKSKEKDKKKDKKEKKKKKDKEKDKEREKAKEKEREKEEKRKEKEREKEKREKEKEKEKERIRLEKVKTETPAALPSPVIPRLTLRVGGQDKIVISKVVPNAEAKTPAPKTPAAKSGPGNRPRTPPPLPILPLVVPTLPAAPSPLPPPLPPAASLLPPPSMLTPAPSIKTPVRSVVTETVSTYVIVDKWGNQIWICPGCNKPDDGSPMIGCDDCDDWYHWPCVGLVAAPPDEQQWFCIKCSSKKKDKKHKKKKHKPH